MYKLLVVLDDGSTVIKTLPNDSFDIVLNKVLHYVQQGFYWTDESGLTTIYPPSRVIKIAMKKEENENRG